MTQSNAAAVRNYLEKNAEEIERALSLFQESAQLFSSDKPRMIDQYENKWVAAHDGEIVAVADTVDLLMTLMAQKGVPANESIVRHIDREPKTLIL